MGVVTGKGLSDLIREIWPRLTFVLMVLLWWSTTQRVTEFIGIAGSTTFSM